MKNKSLYLIAAIILLTRVASVSAANDHSNERAANSASNNGVENQQIHVPDNAQDDNDNKNNNQPSPTSAEISPTGSAVTPSITSIPQADTDCDDNTKNHGSFVSCVAHEHLGGTTVSDAAHSDTGKKNSNDSDEDDVNVSVSPTISPSDSPTITPSGTVTPSITETPTISPTLTVTPGPQNVLGSQIKGLIDQIKDLLKSLTSFFHK